MKSENQKVLLPIAAVAVIIIVLGTFSMKQKGEETPFDKAAKKVSIGKEKEILVGDTLLLVEIADTQEERTRGLSGRYSLESGHGMLFDFGVEDANSTNPFWMKNMKFDLDVIWINDGIVAQMDSNVPAPEPGVKDKDLPLYFPNGPTDYVLELSAGDAKKLGINTGDTVSLSEALGD